MILGIDEVGRGPWAGPLVVGAVVLGGVEIIGLTDSKKLSKKRREELDVEIRKKAVSFGLGWVSADEIDLIGLSKSLELATNRAVEQIDASYNQIIIDGTVNFLSNTSKGECVTTMKKADLLIPCVSAASIIAKVARDKYMEEQDKLYRGYNFKKHVGYGTALHVKAIYENGITPIHRKSFAPIKKYCQDCDGYSNYDCIKSVKISSKQKGDLAEEIAKDYLIKKGHEILDRNWKNKLCEIDIVSKKDDTIYFSEVKYRKNHNQGGGLFAVDKNKVKQIKFAAEYYVLVKKINNYNMRLLVISLSGLPPVIEDCLEI